MTIKIVTDSTSYIPKELIRKYEIEIVSLSVIFGNTSFKETEISNIEFYDKLKKEDKIPTSSQPSIDDICKLFENNVVKGNDIVGIFISSDMSGTYSTAMLAKNIVLEKYPEAKIEILDSRSNCMQLGFAALAAAKASKEGQSFENVITETKKNVKSSKFIFIPDTLEYLKKGGRIGSASALIGGILQIKPILTVIDGKTAVLSKVRTSKKALAKIIDVFLGDIEKFGFGEAIVHHINCEEEARKVAKLINEMTGKIIEVTPIGPVIGTHVGPGAIGIAYYTKEELDI
ncbi:DegV family protein [Clostridium sp. DL1XJH146]